MFLPYKHIKMYTPDLSRSILLRLLGSMELVVYNTYDDSFPFGDALVCATLLLLEKLFGNASSLGAWSWLFTTPMTIRFHLVTPSCMQLFSSWRSRLVTPDPFHNSNFSKKGFSTSKFNVNFIFFIKFLIKIIGLLIFFYIYGLLLATVANLNLLLEVLQVRQYSNLSWEYNFANSGS
jgi:hypothetical protein